MKFTDYFKQKVFSEMAIDGDIIRNPIRLDKDDIEFLYQFPPQLWIQAIKARYHDDLAEALKQREQVRQSDREEIKKLADTAIKEGKYSPLVKKYPEYFTQEVIDNLKNDYDIKYRQYYKEFGKEGYEKARENAARNIAYYIIEKIHPDVPLELEKPKFYNFRLSKKPYKIRAKSFINRLIHKLERTKGLPHAPHVGLDQDEHLVGQYGFDLQNIFTGKGLLPAASQGMQLITKDMAQKAINQFLKDNHQHYYGKLPEIGEEIELPNGSKKIIDTETAVKRAGKKPVFTDDEGNPLNMPTFKQKIMNHATGEIIECDMPFVLSTKYTKYVGSDPKDPNRIGKNKDRIEIHPDNYMNQSTDDGVSSGGSFTSNKNRAEERKKAFGVAGHKEEKESVLGKMEKYEDNDENYPGLYKDIVNGIMQAITQKIPYTAIRDWEAAIAQNSMKELHDLILQRIDNLTSKESFKIKQNRINHAKRTVISFLGQDIHGGETRSLRASQMPAPEVIPSSLRTPQQQELINNLHQLHDETSKIGRKHIAGKFTFPYSNLDTIVKILKDESAEADKNDKIIGASAKKSKEKIKEIFTNNYKRKSFLLSAMKDVLERLVFVASGGNKQGQDAEEEANKIIADHIIKKKTMSAMVAAFQTLTIVQNAMRREVVANVPHSDFGAKQKKSMLPSDILDPRERAETDAPWQSLLAKGDWLALIFRHDYMVKADKTTLLNYKNDLVKQKNLIPQDVYNDAYNELQHYLSLIV